MKAEIVPAVMDIAGQAPQPAATEARPDEQADGCNQQTDYNQEFTEVVHGSGQGHNI
jgi:hypothetical protein